MSEIDESAADTLARAERAQAAIAGSAARYPRYLAIYGLGSILMGAWTGLLTINLAWMIAFVILWPSFVTAISLWVNGQRANLRGVAVRHPLYLAAQMVLFAPLLFFGIESEQPFGYWVLVGLLVSLPIFIAAAYEARLLRKARGSA